MTDSLVARIEDAATNERAIRFVTATGPDSYDVDRVTWAELHRDARSWAAALQRRGRGIKPGDHVAILGPTSRHLVTALQATWLTGATVLVLPLPMRLASIDEFVAQTRARIRAADSVVVLADSSLAEFLDPQPGDPPIVLFDEIAKAAPVIARKYRRPPDDPESLAILQFTSGSTSEPKGVMLPHRCVIANLDAVRHSAGLRVQSDVMMSWLPLYHDMGLIGFLILPMITGTDLVLAAPQDFLSAPSRWVQWMSDFHATVSAGPNFAYALAARAMSRLHGLDLSAWRVALNGAEPVDPETVEAFAVAGARHGLRAGAVFPAFGMAEVTIGGTFPVPGTGIQLDVVDRRVLETDRFAAPVAAGAPDARTLVRLGRPLPGLEIRIVDPGSGELMEEREAGELEIRGTSVTTGYYKQPEATAAAFHDGWLRTGDLAYLVDGELVICGRLKDVIIVGGRNVFPEDVERACAKIDGVRAGNVIAFGTERRPGRAREHLVVVAETKSDDVDPVRDEVSARVTDAVGVPPEVVLVRAGTLPKTSSGKLQRSLCKDQYLEAALDRV
ncbi:MAG: putative fatty-acid--CoA ligase [Actinomycetia bacterium]|nr:putative fatty-acid--CoA ligase [Actinomycetes bacterium]